MSNLKIVLRSKSGVHTFVVDERGDDDQWAVINLGEKATQMLLDSLWKRGMRPSGYVEPSAKPTAVVMIDGRPAADYMSQSEVPNGFYTVVSYLARHNPEVLALHEDLAQDTQRDGFWLSHIAKKRGLRTIKVEAPLVLQEGGIEHVNAYPVALLGERFADL